MTTLARCITPDTPQPDTPLTQDERDVLEAIRAFGPLPYDQIGRRAMASPVELAIAFDRVATIPGVTYLEGSGYAFIPPATACEGGAH